MNRFVFLLAIAIALMSLSTASAQRVRVNNFTPFNIRPDVAIRGGGGVNVNVGGFNNFGHRGGAVFVNSFGGFNNHRSTVFVQPSFFQPAFFPPAQVFVAPQSPVFVSPTSLYGFGGYGGFQTFSTFSGGCSRW